MTKLRDRHEDVTRLPAEPTRARPVILATLSVRVDPSAERMAIDSALEASVPLIIANLLPFRPYPTTFGLLGACGSRRTAWSGLLRTGSLPSGMDRRPAMRYKASVHICSFGP